MRKPLILSFLTVALVIGLSLVISTAIQGQVQPGGESSGSQTAQPKYILGPQVIGSGGVMGATSPNHWHSATAGQTLVGGAHGANHTLLAGFWHMRIPTPTHVSPDVVESGLPTSFELHQNFPNPFNPQTTISYELPQASRVNVAIFNVMGQRIRLLVHDTHQGPGAAKVTWDGRDDEGRMVGSGIYLYRITASALDATNILFQDIKKMILVK